MKTWLKLLVHNNKVRRFGLTLPFLVGALRINGEGLRSAKDELFGILQSMRDESASEHTVRIAECDRLHQPVAAIIPGWARPAIGKGIPSPQGGRTSLYIEEQYLIAGGSSLDALNTEFVDRAVELVDGSAFSFQNGEYREFMEEDLAFIRDALAFADGEGEADG